MKTWASILALVVLHALAREGWAGEPSSEEARTRANASFRDAQAAFARRDFRGAAEGYEQAARFEPHPFAFLNAADAWERAGEPVRAAENCDAVLRLRETEPRFRDDAARRLQQLERKIGTLSLSGPPTTLVRIDDAGQVALPAVRRLAPGRHRIVVVDPTSSGSRSFEVELQPGERRALSLAPANADARDRPPAAAVAPSTFHAPAVPNQPTVADEGGGIPTASWVAFGIAGAATVATAVFGVVTLEAKSDFEAQPTQEGLDGFNRDRLLTNVALGVAVAAGVTGVVIWLATPRRPAARPTAMGAFGQIAF